MRPKKLIQKFLSFASIFFWSILRADFGCRFWDWIFGTLYIPDHYERFEIGLGKGIKNPHNSLAKAYYVPLVEAWAALAKKFN